MKLNVTIDEKLNVIPMSDTKLGDVFVFDYYGEEIIAMHVFGNRVVSPNNLQRTWINIDKNDTPVRLLPSGTKVTIEVP